MYSCLCDREEGYVIDDFAKPVLEDPVQLHEEPIMPRVIEEPPEEPKGLAVMEPPQAPKHPMVTKKNEHDVEYTIVLSKSNPNDADKDIRCHGDYLIDTIEQPKIKDWNRSNPKKQVMPGDQIILVNGYGLRQYYKHPSSLIDTSFDPEDPIEDASVVKLRLKRLTNFTVDYVHSGIIGLKLNKQTLVIKDIMDGFVKDYNKKTTKKEEVVYPGDTVVGVNNEKADKQRMLTMLRGHRDGKEFTGRISIAFKRPSVET